VAAGAVPVVGRLSLSCADPFPAAAEGAVLIGYRLGSDEAPDILFDETAAGGPSLGGATLSGFSYTLDDNWRQALTFSDRVIALVAAPGYLLIDSDQAGPSAGAFGTVALQVVGAYDDGAPRVTPTPYGNVLAFAPLVDLEPAPTAALCTTAGDALRGASLIVGYNVYRLPADQWLSPTLRDFLVHGFVGHVSLATLDFAVLDVGSGSSDLLPSDEVTLLNPDGLARTGDETIVFADVVRTPSGRVRDEAPDPTRPYWYRVQPVARGRLAYFADGRFGRNLEPSRVLDLDGDGTPESADILADGVAEFIDPSRSGLGLAHGGEILSSPWPGLVEPLRPALDSDADGLADAYEIDHYLDPLASNDGVDTDGDGLPDLLEAEMGSHPALADSDAAGEDDGREALYGRSPTNASDDVVIPAGRPLGDLAPSAGNGKVDVGDVVRLLRAAVGVDAMSPLEVVLGDVSPATVMEADAVPALARRVGDGRLDVADVVVELRVAVGLMQLAD
jgi:hypothetical protein